jgi:DNA-binding MarR family transcriptional regulator/N-acetylglutamate synthase-like GNAT family acetyltransferase
MIDPTAAVRRFNRFYTRHIGVLGERLLESDLSLTEVRVLYELAHRQPATASEIARDLRLDAGYLSRMLRGFSERGWLIRARSPDDGRQNRLRLSRQGRRLFDLLDARSDEQVRATLRALTRRERGELVAAMETIERLFEHRAEAAPLVLRAHRPGDMGWVVFRHGALYAEEYGWDERFEALVARIVADFVDHFDPRRERCWIAEAQGETVGSVFLVAQSRQIAKLRLLYVEPSARGQGIGRRLVDQCVAFARTAGYRAITLWTQSNLLAARRLYDRAGFHLIHTEPNTSFGRDLMAETWQLSLRAASP